jgi:hypothetical protein
MDINIMHLFIVILCILGMFIMGRCLYLAKRGAFFIGVILFSIVLLINAFLFSAVRLLVPLGVDLTAEASFFNWWSIFIRLHTVVTICGIGYLAMRKIQGKIS